MYNKAELVTDFDYFHFRDTKMKCYKSIMESLILHNNAVLHFLRILKKKGNMLVIKLNFKGNGYSQVCTRVVISTRKQKLEMIPFTEIFTGADPGFCQGGGPQLLRPKVADVAKRCHASEASILWPGSRAHLRALEAFGFLMLKYAFSHILETLFLLFLTSILTPKVDKNRALDLTSINLRHSDMLHLFFNLHEKVML